MAVTDNAHFCGLLNGSQIFIYLEKINLL